MLLTIKPVRHFILICLSAVCIPLASAQTAYVTDKLRLGLHNASDTSDTPFRMLESGTQLEVIERTRLYARVRTLDGVEGWTKAGFLIDEKPARARLAELEAQISSLDGQLKTARSELEEATGRVSALQEQAFTATSSAEEIGEELSELESETAKLRARVGGFSVPFSWAFLTSIVTLGAGFLAGLTWIDRQIRKRHGGFRLY